MIKVIKDNFSLRKICESGQCFRLQEIGPDLYELVALGRYLKLEQQGEEISFHCSEEEFQNVWRSYFDLDSDYGQMMDSVRENDPYLQEAVNYGRGIRILKQDLWEIIVSFIVSQQNNIKRIRRCIALLCERYGERRQTPEGQVYYAFPTPEALAGAELEDLAQCNLGYRNKYIKKAAQSICLGDVSLEAISTMSYGNAAKELKKLCGVGDKVAECICLFALHQLDAFPVDTHIKKVLECQYPKGFPFDAYPGYAGVMQQYIFYYDLARNVSQC